MKAIGGPGGMRANKGANKRASVIGIKHFPGACGGRRIMRRGGVLELWMQRPQLAGTQ